MYFRHFHINQHKDTRVNGCSGTVAIETVGNNIRIGVAITNPKDNFNRKRSRQISQGKMEKNIYTKLEEIPDFKELYDIAQEAFETEVNKLN